MIFMRTLVKHEYKMLINIIIMKCLDKHEHEVLSQTRV